MTGLASWIAFKRDYLILCSVNTQGDVFCSICRFYVDLQVVFHDCSYISRYCWRNALGFLPVFSKLFKCKRSNYSIMFTTSYVFGGYLIQRNSVCIIYKARTNYLPVSVQFPSWNTGSNVNFEFLFAIIIELFCTLCYKNYIGYELKATGFNKIASDMLYER